MGTLEVKQSKNNKNVLITMEHIRKAGGCATHARTWFALYNLDFKAFIKNGGIDSKIALRTGDALAIRAAKIAMQEHKERSQ